MVSTYTLNQGIEKPAAGDQSGTWGATVNTNMDIIDRAASGVGALTLTGTTTTLTTTDGTLSDGMYRVLVLGDGGDLGGNNTITLSPNNADKLYLVYNNLSADRSAIFTQGIGDNATVENGETAWIYADGAGSGAAVRVATSSTKLLDQDGDTGIRVEEGGDDDDTIRFDIAGAEDFTMTANTFTAQAGSTIAAVTLSASGNVDFNGDLDVDGTTNLDVVDIDGAVNMATTALVTGVLTTTAATVFNGGFASNAASTISTADNLPQITLISTDADSNAGPILKFYRNSSSPADVDNNGNIQFIQRNDNSQDFTAGQIRCFTEDASDGTEDSSIDFLVINAGASNNAMVLGPTESVFNESSADRDFRVESDGNTHALFVQGSDGNVGIGDTSPAALLTVKASNTSYTGGFRIEDSDSTTASAMTHVNGTFYLSANTTADHLVINSSGNVGISTSVPGQILDVNSGSGNMIADGYDTHSLAVYKENIENASGYLDRVLACPAQTWNRRPFVSADEIRTAVLEEFGEDVLIEEATEAKEAVLDKDGNTLEPAVAAKEAVYERRYSVWDDYFPESYRDKAIYNMPAGDLKDWIDDWCESKRVKMRPEVKWQKKRLGLVADAESTAKHLPEVISINDEGEPTGIDTMTYIGILHNAIQELTARLEALE